MDANDIIDVFAKPSRVFLITHGDGSDGNELSIEGVYGTREKAEARMTQLGWNYQIEEWPVE